MATLYQDPMRGEKLVITGDSIGMNMVPDEWSFSDPVFLRHVLCLMLVIHNIFHIILCCCQLNLCRKSNAPPDEMVGIISPEKFQESKDKEQHRVQLELFNWCMDTIYSCLDLYLCTLTAIWQMTVDWYGYATKIWLNVTFMTLFSTYLVIRILPSLFYEKLVLDRKYHVDPETTPPLIGMLCALAFIVVFLQLGVIPLTAVFMSLAGLDIWLFVLVSWLVVLVISLLVYVFTGIFGFPCLGKSRLLNESDMDQNLSLVLQTFDFSGRVYVVHTFFVGYPSAWVMGCCCCRRLDIHDTLMLSKNVESSDLPATHMGDGLNDEQLVAFVAHQLAHWRLRHVPISFVVCHLIVMTYLGIFGCSFNWQTLYAAAGFTKVFPHSVGYWLVYKYLMPVYRTISIWLLFYILRRFEYAADAYVCLRGFGRPMKAALLKLFADRCVFPYVHPAYRMWHHHRPSCLQRIWNLQLLESRL